MSARTQTAEKSAEVQQIQAELNEARARLERLTQVEKFIDLGMHQLHIDIIVVRNNNPRQPNTPFVGVAQIHYMDAAGKTWRANVSGPPAITEKAAKEALVQDQTGAKTLIRALLNSSSVAITTQELEKVRSSVD
jgi:hypothetical protein